MLVGVNSDKIKRYCSVLENSTITLSWEHGDQIEETQDLCRIMLLEMGQDMHDIWSNRSSREASVVEAKLRFSL